jgi:8-oxo-dGTP pyrophosphatase MutT (NUDIX family)
MNTAASVCVILNKYNQVLLLKRRPDDLAHPDLNGDGLWCLPGGKRNNQEDSLMCVKREVYEETGIVMDSDPEFILMFDNSLSVYLYKALDTPFVELSNEHIAFDWLGATFALSMLNLVGVKTSVILYLIKQLK